MLPRQRVRASRRTPTGRPRTTSPRSANLTKPDTKRTRVRRHHRRSDRQGQGALLLQPRARHDRSRRGASSFPARPDLNWSPTTQDRVWNTMVRFDQQMNASHTWGVRWLRELSPQRNQAITAASVICVGAAHPRGRRQGPDRRRDVVVGARQHQAEHAARRLDAGGRGVRQPLLQRQRPRPGRRASRRWRSRPSPISRTTPRRRASTTPIRSRTRSPGSCPNKRGDHDVKFGAQYEYVEADNLDQDNLNGTFTLRPEQRAVQRQPIRAPIPIA